MLNAFVMAEKNADATLRELFDGLEVLLKSPEVGHTLAARGVNTSIGLVALQGVRAYLDGQKARAVEDLATALDEIRARHEAARRRTSDDS